MSVVRIPKPDEDAFPWPRVVIAAAIGGVLGLGIAWCGMETDRSARMEGGAEVATTGEPTAESSVGAPDERPSERSTEGVSETGTEAVADLDAGEIVTEPDAAAEPDDAAEPVDVGAEADDDAPVAPAEVTPASSALGAAVTLRRGRIAYLRCDGVPQRPGPFPCPRDEVLEDAVWSALGSVERCARSPGVGQADLVVDLAGDAAPTIRTRDTFPPETPRTEDAALLACTSGSLENVRSSLSPRRLVVSFRLTLDRVGS